METLFCIQCTIINLATYRQFIKLMLLEIELFEKKKQTKEEEEEEGEEKKFKSKLH